MSAMSVSLSRDFTIHCLLHGDYTIIPVKTASDTLVGELKKIIKTKAPNSLSNVDAHQLTLYYVSVPNDVTITRDLDLLSLGRPLEDAMQTLQTIFTDGPKQIDYIVSVPPGKQTYSALSFPLVFLAPNILVMRCHTFACLWIR